MNKKKLIKAIKSVDVESESSHNISVAMSSNASIYKDINTRLTRAYGNDFEYIIKKETEKIKKINADCPVDELKDVLGDI